MKTFAITIKRALLVGLCCAPALAAAFNSGSTGADGALNPTANTQLQVPENGVFNFSSVNIPAGVTVSFKRNTVNTPVTMLVSGDVTIAGKLSVAGQASPGVGAGGDGNLADDGAGGIGGPGGYDGGRGGTVDVKRGGNGLGPGAGSGGSFVSGNNSIAFGGAGAGYSVIGTANKAKTDYGLDEGNGNHGANFGGPAYGSNLLLPLVGGSGGGGGAGGVGFPGSGGGGGGGAILLAVSGKVTVAAGGVLDASGGASGANPSGGYGGTGGSGSGGAIRIVASSITGEGSINAEAGAVGTVPDGRGYGGVGAVGRIRLEADNLTRAAATKPPYLASIPGQLTVPNMPTLSITSVAGVAAPASPSGNADISLPSTTPNPVAVVFTTTGVPPGNTVKLVLTPSNAAPTVLVSSGLAGSTASATATVNVNLPSGPSVLSASTSFTVVAALGDLMRNFAGGERVGSITLAATLGAPGSATLVTVSGKEYPAPQAALVLAGLGG